MKIGDLVECLETISEFDGGPKKGELFSITSVNQRDNLIGFKLHRYSNENIADGVTPNWGKHCFKLVKSSWIEKLFGEAKSATPQRRFNYRDEVVVTKGFYKGLVGHCDYYDYREKSYHVINNEGKIYNIYCEHLERVKKDGNSGVI